MIQTGLVTGNACIDFLRTTFFCFEDKILICQKRPGHGNHVSHPISEQTLSNIRIIDTVGGDQGNLQMRL